MPIHQLMYVSGATRPMGASDIADILQKSRANNARLGVTGMLLYADSAFIQVLEGEAATVRSLSRRIQDDPRHRNFMVLVEMEAQSRAFGQWQMGFRHIDADKTGHGAIFRASREALAGRISGAEGNLLLEAILAFGRDFIVDA